ncbi:putative transcription initiation factor iif subunit alpha [Phaeomoniella chlamydospora]|uniref:Putative transcription initiation factor iif subunit alpha n=1 Tax=Phaeomoniella chlamydospora TaxID=158046 RepID=A0A0G2G3B7_PHACM|nr:putative transcription initiation factor iif subunit alpha [Phaeomoniella chlamydospora]
MSSTPPTVGARPNTNGQAASVIKRRPVGVDPLVQKKQAPKYRPPPARKPPPAANGHLTPVLSNPRPASAHSSPPKLPLSAQKPEGKNDVSGFSDPAVGQYQDFKLFTTKKQLLDGLRFHVLNLTGKENVDLTNTEEFTRPVRLHRRDPRAPPPGQIAAKEEAEEPPPNDMDTKEREAYLKRKEERQKEREANLAQIAPSIEAGKKIRNFAKKTEQVFRPGQSADQRLKYRDKYEEKLPWHLEDFNDKHCLVGTNQPTMSHQYAALFLEDDSARGTPCARLIPVEKWYKFAPKKTVKTLTIEEAEREMKKLQKDPDWLLKTRMEAIKERENEMLARMSKGLYTTSQGTSVAAQRAEDGAADLDFEDDFADDEEGNLFEEKDEDQKLAEQRIKQEQLSANFFDNKDEREVDIEEKKEQLMRSLQGKYSKKLNKALRKREGNYNLGSDSDEDNPYASDSSSTDSESEQIKKEEEAKAKEEKAAQSSAEGGKSGTSTRGTNTPSGRKEKHGGTGSDRDMAARKAGSVKRSGTPNLSDAGSGTDASVRKKDKHKHLRTAASTVPGSRSSSLVPDASQSKKRKSLAPGMGGAGSDSEGGGRAGAASPLSDSGNPSSQKRLKLNPPTTSPPLSRATSPRPGSPPAGSSSEFAGLPDPSEIAPEIPATGISVMELYKIFKSRGQVPDSQRPAFWKLIQQVGKINKGAKWVMPRTGGKARGDGEEGSRAGSPAGGSPTGSS